MSKTSYVPIIEVYDPLRLQFIFRTPRKIVFGVNTVNNVGTEAEQLGARKAVIICDEGIRKAGIVDKVTKSLEEKGVEFEIWDKVEPEPHVECAEDIVRFVRDGKFDLVIGVGGGSSMDMAKTAAVLVENPGPVKDYIGVGLIKKPGIPKILIPTTAGTGSECTHAAVMSIGRIKRWIADPALFADVAIIDPMLTLSLPPKLTAGTGLDALSHAIECIMSINANSITDSLALSAIKLIFENLRVAYYHGKNLEARYNMSLAATMAGMVVTNAGAVLGHSACYTYASDYRLPHGVSCAIALPYVMWYNLPVSAHKLALIAEAMGFDIKGLSVEEAAWKAIKAVKKLIEDVKLPTSLKEIGVPKEKLPEYAEELVTQYPRPNNPRRVTKEDILVMYEKMWEGEL